MTDDVEDTLTEAEWLLRAELRSDWAPFCNADYEEMQGDRATFDERMEAAGFIELVAVSDEALQDSFAYERGIRKGGMMWQLTAAGKAILDAPKLGARPST